MFPFSSVTMYVIRNAGRYAIPSFISGFFFSLPLFHHFFIWSASCMLSPSFFGLIIFLPTRTSFISQSPSISVFMLASLMNNSFSILLRNGRLSPISMLNPISVLISPWLSIIIPNIIVSPVIISVFSIFVFFIFLAIIIVAGYEYTAPMISRFRKKSENIGIISLGNFASSIATLVIILTSPPPHKPDLYIRYPIPNSIIVAGSAHSSSV